MRRSAAGGKRPKNLSWGGNAPRRYGIKLQNRCDVELDRGLGGRCVMRNHTQGTRGRSTLVRGQMIVTAERQRHQREDDKEKHPSTLQDLTPPTHVREQYIRRLRSWSNLPAIRLTTILRAFDTP